MPEEKFAPPPSNVVIRTMEKDIQALQQGGGEIPAPAIPEEPNANAPAQGQNAFLYQTPQPAAPAIPAPPPPGGGMATEPAPDMGGMPEEKSSKSLLFALAGIVGLLALGALGYFVVFPIVRNAFAPAPTITPPLRSPSASPSPTVEPSPSPTPPLVTLARQADATVDLTLSTTTTAALSAALIEHAATAQAAGAFHVVVPKTADGYLDAATVFPLLFANAPMALSSALGGPYGIYLYWTDPQTPYLGVYFALNPAAADAASSALREWEPTLAADANRMFLGRAPGTMQGTFRDGTYQNVPLRFAVFDSGLAIDHAIIANTFVFTTDKNSMFEAIRRLAGVE